MSEFKTKNIVDSQELPEDKKVDLNIRPTSLSGFIGQDKLKKNLKIFIKAALKRKEALDHSLFHGSHGLGKTTLSYIIAKEMNSQIQITSGPALEKVGDLAAILTNLKDKGILFIDEIHRLNRNIEEALYPAMEEYALDIIVGKGPSAKILRIDLPKFTLIGATTRPSLISPPLRDRFGAVFQIDFYKEEDIKDIIKRSSSILEIKIEDQAAFEIAKRSRFTPRIANRLLKRVRDFAHVKNVNIINLDIVFNAMDVLEIDKYGLNYVDRKILDILIKKFSGGPIGVKTLSAATGEDINSLEEIYEAYLMQIGFLERTPRGRKVTNLAYKHLGYKEDLLL
ncbi:Holliday junction branch migration DNA helicase RuvB [Patescibacteria group bacterium]|nr:Holliday junction branch migration DNA helicase RuvB [Patescibacteria group bacterium]